MTFRNRLMGRSSRTLWSAVFAVVCLTIAAGCGSSNESSSSSSTAGSTTTGSVKGKSVILVDGAPADPFIAAYNRSFTNGLKAKGVKVSVLSNNFDSAVEQQKLNQAISKRPSLIAVAVQDATAVAAPFAKAKQAGIPVVIVINPASPRAVALSSGQFLDNQANLGKFAAINLQQGLAKTGVKSGNVIAITGSASQLGVQQRLEAFRKQMAKTPGLKIVEVQDGQWDPVKTGQISSQLFAKYRGKGGIKAAYGMSDLMAVSITRSAKSAGMPVGVKSKGVIVSGSNCGPDGIKAIKAGTLYGGATQAPTTQAARAAEQILKLLSGQSVPKVQLFPVQRITAANVDTLTDVCTY
jgi:ABC-type sugar transport system substrate-binding protein